MSGIVFTEMHVNSALFGARYERYEDIKFSRIEFGFDLLQYWGKTQTMKIEFPKHRNAKYNFALNYKYATPITATLDNFRITLMGFVNHQIERMRIALEIGAFLDVRPANGPITVEQFFKTVATPLNGIINLSLDYPIVLTRVSGYSSEHSMEMPDGKVIESAIDWLFQQRIEVTPSKRNFNEHDALIPSPIIVSEFNELLNAWFHLFSQHETELGRFFNLLSRSTMLEDRFLETTKIIERYMKRRMRNPSLKLKKAVEELLMSSNVISSRLLNDPKEFAAKVVRVRDWGVHLNDKNKTDSLELYFISEALCLIFKFFLLVELRIADDEIIRLTENRRDLANLKNIWRMNNMLPPNYAL